MRNIHRALLTGAAALLGLLTTSARATSFQDLSPASPHKDTIKTTSEDRPPVTFKRVFFSLPTDQKMIWLSPFRLRSKDSAWLLPLAGTTGLLIGSDQHSMVRERSNTDAATLSKHVSDGGLIALATWPATMYAWGSLRGSPRAHETGLLSGEAMINSLALNEALKLVFSRERPTALDGQGKFFSKVGNTAFPSTHATLSWTAASVIAHEYPGPLMQALAYGTAATVSIARVTSREHFPSDVIVGSALGWLVGRQIYNAHHDSEIDGADYGSFRPAPGEFDEDSLGSTFVPLDSWVYPALKRLAGLGYIQSQFAGLEPWTRRECRRQVEEAEYFTQDLPPESDAAQMVARVKQECSGDGTSYYSAQIDSVYSRYTNISGTPLRDSYHFGQTIWNDFGRPFDEGSNVLTGAEGSAIAGRFFFYARGEYQHAPGREPLSDAQRELIGSLDLNPVQPASAIPNVDRFYPLDLYAGVQLGQYALTFGKQSLWLGPDEMSPLMVSDNADPMYMLRFSRTIPLVLPGFLHLLGQIRGEFLFSKLSGHQFPARPFFNLQKISFHPTDNLEIGFTRASIWAGVGHPFTAHSLLRNFASLGDTGSTFNDRNDPGDRKSGFDFSYRIPGLRHWLTFYADAYSDDDPSPIANPRRAAWNPGIYLSHVPLLPKVDLRAEATSTQALTATDRGPGFIYLNTQYHDANTNKGFIFGSPVGRDGRGYQSWSTYHFSAVNSLEVSYRQTKISNAFLPGGGTQNDASTSWGWQARSDLRVDTLVRYERWLIPSLQLREQTDISGMLKLTFVPHLHIHHQ